ncbi:protein of unknown function [Nitrospira japonica]|uniref:Uncharacterized protein n=1 Tax=Nitrospira japonica TaxID=1325564 RepID=A0A1W1IB61_9BACT|nr:protein of unknown function [Nitrospira japonica]
MTIGQAVCREYRIASGFVWPPVPSYRFDNNLLRNPEARVQPHRQQAFDERPRELQ